MSIVATIKANPFLKKMVHFALIPRGLARPRLWVRWFLNPFFHKTASSSIIRRRTRMDVFPFNPFELGPRSIIEDFCTVNNGVGAVIIGHDTTLGIGSVIIGPVEVGNHVIMAQHILISGLNHDYQDVTMPIHKQPTSKSLIKIEDECWIGGNVVITAGVTIGKHSVVAAGSVVTKNIPAYSVAVGNPARVIKQYNFETKTWNRI